MSHGRHKDTLKCPKDTGTCSVCCATFRIHRSTGHVHRHGNRDSPCPGSDKPPISTTLTKPSADTTKRHTDTLSQTQDEQSPATSGRGSKLSHHSWVTLVKRIPRSARPSSAALLTEILRKITGSPIVKQLGLSCSILAQSFWLNRREVGRREI